MESPPARGSRRRRSQEFAPALARDIQAAPDRQLETRFVFVVEAASDRRHEAESVRKFEAAHPGDLDPAAPGHDVIRTAQNLIASTVQRFAARCVRWPEASSGGGAPAQPVRILETTSDREFEAGFVFAFETPPGRDVHAAPGRRPFTRCEQEFVAAAQAVEFRYPVCQALGAPHSRHVSAPRPAGSGGTAVAKPVGAAVAKFVGAAAEIHRRPPATRLERSPAEKYRRPAGEKLDRPSAETPGAPFAEEAVLFVAAGGNLR